MASIEELKRSIDLHDLADKLGLERPQGGGNYRSPHHDDRNPSLSIYDGGRKWKDFSDDDAGGSCIDLVMHVEGCEAADAIRRLHDLYNLPLERPDTPRTPQQPKTRAEYIAARCFDDTAPARAYLVEDRKIDEEVVDAAIKRQAIGCNHWHSEKREQGEVGYGGTAAAFIVRSLNPGHVVAVDLRYLDPELNGGVKTMSQGDKAGWPWVSDLKKLERAHTVYVVESAINALSIESCKMGGVAAIATRGTGAIEQIDWRVLRGKAVRICMDWDQPNEKGDCPGTKAAWRLLELLNTLDISAMLVDQSKWDEYEWNDVNDILKDADSVTLRSALNELEAWLIPGKPGKMADDGRRERIYLPAHDFAEYWRFRQLPDFLRRVTTKKGPDGDEREEPVDVAGFRVAGITRVQIASSTSAMTGEPDLAPKTLFSVSVQTARHGPRLIRKVFEDERLHNVDHWQKFGPIYNRSAFLRAVNILERGADLGATKAVNFVGLAWHEGKPKVNEGPDCYFTLPRQQCPYHNLTFPRGNRQDAMSVVAAYQETFRENAATIALVWALGGHLKAFTGFWPHLVMEANKGAGKSTLIKRLERSIGFTMFSRQSMGTGFRQMTSVSHTSHPVGWEEISAGKQEVIDQAVNMLQEAYNFTTTMRSSDMTEFLISAPVLLAGEDVPVKSLIGKLVQTDLTGKKGPMMPDDLKQFPVREWLEFLATFNRPQIKNRLEKARSWLRERLMAARDDDGATRMLGNYAALLCCWGLLCDWLDLDRGQGGFPDDLLQAMNSHISGTNAEREPWVWIVEILFSEISSRRFAFPFRFDVLDDKEVLCVRPSHVMDHISHSTHLRGKFDSLPIKSHGRFRKQLVGAGVLAKESIERTINRQRIAHMVALDLKALERYGLSTAIPEDLGDEIGIPD